MGDITELVVRAGRSDRQAWDELVARFAPLVWSVGRAHRLGDADCADVSQQTWLRLAEHVAELREPGRVGAWLATTARRECLRLLAARHREGELPDEWPDERDGPEARLLTSARDQVLWRELAGLPERCRRLLRLIAYAPELSYAQLGLAIGVAPGSVGPTRGRCLRTLRGKVVSAGLGVR